MVMLKMSDVIWFIDFWRDKFEDFLVRMQEYVVEILVLQYIDYWFKVDNLDVNKSFKVDFR